SEILLNVKIKAPLQIDFFCKKQNPMNKKNYIIFFLILCSFSVNAQNKSEIFRLPSPDLKVSNSLYHSIRLLDIRKDTSHYGILQKGAFNRKAEVVAEPALGI